MFKAALGILAIVGIVPTVAEAQQATVFYDHRPGSVGVLSRVTYRDHNDLVDARRAGLPKRLTVPRGGTACFVVENANSVLYSYSVGARSEAIEVPEALGDLLPTIQMVLNAAMARGFSMESPTFEKYALEVAQVQAQLSILQSTRSGSDKTVSIAEAAASVRQALGNVVAAATNAEHTYNALRKPLGAGSTREDTLRLVALDVLRAHQAGLVSRAMSIGDAFDTAAAADGEALCVPVEHDRARVFLSVARRDPEAARSRPHGDTLVAFEVDALSDAVFEVIPGAVLSLVTQDKLSFRLSDGVVRSDADRNPRLRAGVLALARAWAPTWIWGGFGVSAESKGVADLFVGPVGRFGFQGNGPAINMGVGLSLSWINTGLKNGAVLDQPLPPGAKDLDAVVDREMRAGVGVVFTVSGLLFKE